jgi:uncharacterized protein
MYIYTFTGRKVNPLEAQPEDIDIRDVAHSLAMQCRFNGHTRQFYSVAEHSWHVSRMCDAADGQTALWGLLHDASEAYLQDIQRPLKQLDWFRQTYRPFEDRLMATICRRFGLPEEQPEAVTVADRRMAVTEGRDLMNATARWIPGVEPYYWKMAETLTPEDAESVFLRRFERLTTQAVAA